MNPKDQANYNGQVISGQHPIASLTHHPLLFSDSVQEQFLVINQNIPHWEAHYFSLMSSMRIFRMEIPMHWTPEFLFAESLKIVPSSMDNLGYLLNIQVFRENHPHKYLKSSKVSFGISVLQAVDVSFNNFLENYEVELFKDHLVSTGLLSNITLKAQTIGVLASIYSKENGVDDCLLLNQNKMVIGGSSSTLFWVRNNLIRTPPIEDGTQKTVIRTLLIDQIRKSGKWIIEEKSISPFELQQADELFLIDYHYKLQPITLYRKKRYSKSIVSEMSKCLSEIFVPPLSK